MNTVSESSLTPHPGHLRARNRRRVFLGIICVMLALIVGVGVWVYAQFHARPFVPTQLASAEQVVLDQKLEQLEGAEAATPPEKTVQFTARELNALLAKNTGLGEAARIDFDKNAITAKWNVPVEEGVPFLGGKTLRGKVSFGVQLDSGKLSLRIDDVRVCGISLPNAWLGGLKDVDLAEKFFAGDPAFQAFVAGIESLNINPDGLKLVLAE